MDDLALATPLWLAALAIGVNALVGALVGYLDPKRHWDVVGVTAFATVMGLGGGVLRDLLIGIPPQSLRTVWPAAVVILGVLVARGLTPWLRRHPRLLGPLDAVALAMFAMTGAASAAAHGLPWVSAVLVGVVSAVGGGVLVSVLRAEVPTILQPSRPHALLAALVALAYLAAARLDADLAYVLGAVLAVGLYAITERRQIRTRSLTVAPAPAPAA